MHTNSYISGSQTLLAEPFDSCIKDRLETMLQLFRGL